MKELSIEEKAKRYDEAIKQIKECTPDENGFITIYPQEIFHQLKESEDERIRQFLIHEVMETSDEIMSYRNMNKKSVIAWLEKQGNLMKALQEANKEIGELVEENYYLKEKQGVHNSNYIHITQTIIDYINKNKEKFENDTPKLGDIWKVKEVCAYPGVNNGKPVVEIENDKGAWMRLPLDIVNIIQGGSTILSNSSNIGKDEQKPAWSEEDEAIYYGVIETEQYMLDVVNGMKKFAVGNISIKEECTRELNWLKSLKDRVQPKQEWSEEDERMYRGLHNLIYSTPYCDSRKELSDWLKFLKDRYTWKPSDEQIGVIEAVINNRSFQRRHLDSLYEQLKKLREE